MGGEHRFGQCPEDRGPNLVDDDSGEIGIREAFDTATLYSGPYLENGPDLLIGSFSKTFASNGGFVAMKEPAITEYLKMYSSPQTFSNALSPVQVAVVRAALAITKSGEGAVRREQLYENSIYLRAQLARNGFTCLGEPSAIVPVFLGQDGPARALWETLSNNGVASNLVEFPGVATNRARIRMQVQSAHTRADADYFVKELATARDYIERGAC